MSRIGDERISHLAHLAVRAIEAHGTIHDEMRALNAAKLAIAGVLRKDDRLDALVRKRMPPSVQPGTRDWDIRYRQLMEEERRKAR